MKKTLLFFIVILFLSFFLLCGCESQSTADGTRSYITELSELSDKRIGTNIGTTHYDSLRNLFPNAEYTVMESYVDLTVALESGRIDAFSADEPIAEIIARKNDDLVTLEGDISQEDYAFMLYPGNEALKEQLDALILRYRENGTLDALWEKWIESDNPEALSIDITQDSSAANGCLRVFAENDLEGFSFVNAEGELAGYEIELISMLAADMGMYCEFTGTNFSALIPGLACGKADVALGCISVSAERAKSVLFTEPYHYGHSIMVTLADTEAQQDNADTTFGDELTESFRSTFITDSRWKLILNGLWSTLQITVISILIGTAFGFAFSFPLRSKNKPLRKVSAAISAVLDGMPLMVLMLVLYYVVFAKLDVSPFSVAVLGLSLDFGNSSANMLNSGIQTVSRGQLDAASSLGYSKIGRFRSVVFPQAATQMFDQYKSAIMGLVKNSAIVGYITVEDLTRVSDIIRCRTYEAFFPLIVTAVIYFALARMLMAMLSFISNKIRPQSRDNILKGIDTKRCEGSKTRLESMHTNKEFQGKPIVSLRHLEKSNGLGTDLHDINIDIYGGDVIALLGPTASGKTSLLYCMDILSPINAGEIIFAGENVLDKHYDMQKLREKMGLVFQNFHLFEHRTVIENVMMAPVDVLGMDRQSAYELSISMLDAVGMADKALSYPGELSGGQLQRAAIARTLAMTPDVILFDEPTSALDPSMRGEVRSVIKTLAAAGYTILLSTNDLNFASELATRVIYMENGRIYDDTTPENVFDNPVNPKTKAFIKRMKSFIRTIDGKHFDFIGMTNDLTEFGHNLWWSKKQIYKINLLFEEICVQLLLPRMEDGMKVEFSLIYTETEDETNMVFRYPGESFDPLSVGDAVTEALIRNSVSAIEHSYAEDLNNLTIKF